MTYLTADELAGRLKYNSRYVTNVLRTQCFQEGRHYVRPFGGRKILYIWENIEADMKKHSAERAPVIPMARGRRAARG